MSSRVVCISSQDGAGGQETAMLVASMLEFRLIDEDIVARAAVEAGVEQEVVADTERRKSLLVRLVEGLGPAGVGTPYVAPSADIVGAGQPASEELRSLIRSVIDETAANGSIVIHAHAASLALAERNDVLRVLVAAPTPTREQRIQATLGVSSKEAARAVKRADAGRADYMKRFYGVSEEQPTHYDLVVNTDRLTPEQAARLIVQAAGGRADATAAGAQRQSG